MLSIRTPHLALCKWLPCNTSVLLLGNDNTENISRTLCLNQNYSSQPQFDSKTLYLIRVSYPKYTNIYNSTTKEKKHSKVAKEVNRFLPRKDTQVVKTLMKASSSHSVLGKHKTQPPWHTTSYS